MPTSHRNTLIFQIFSMIARPLKFCLFYILSLLLLLAAALFYIVQPKIFAQDELRALATEIKLTIPGRNYSILANNSEIGKARLEAGGGISDRPRWNSDKPWRHTYNGDIELDGRPGSFDITFYDVPKRGCWGFNKNTHGSWVSIEINGAHIDQQPSLNKAQLAIEDACDKELNIIRWRTR